MDRLVPAWLRWMLVAAMCGYTVYLLVGYGAVGSIGAQPATSMRLPGATLSRWRSPMLFTAP